MTNALADLMVIITACACLDIDFISSNNCVKKFENVKNALKRLEIIDKLNEKYCDDIQKSLKSLEIIKENIGLKMSIDEDSGDEDTACLYVPLDNKEICIVGYVIGKEKIDLLKEVLK